MSYFESYWCGKSDCNFFWDMRYMTAILYIPQKSTVNRKLKGKTLTKLNNPLLISLLLKYMCRSYQGFLFCICIPDSFHKILEKPYSGTKPCFYSYSVMKYVLIAIKWLSYRRCHSEFNERRQSICIRMWYTLARNRPTISRGNAV